LSPHLGRPPVSRRSYHTPPHRPMRRSRGCGAGRGAAPRKHILCS
jgi:hypothetical protein